MRKAPVDNRPVSITSRLSREVSPVPIRTKPVSSKSEPILPRKNRDRSPSPEERISESKHVKKVEETKKASKQSRDNGSGDHGEVRSKSEDVQKGKRIKLNRRKGVFPPPPGIESEGN